MDFDLRLLPAFVALADELHFGRAAERLHVGQPALSQQLARLERQLGVRLVQRDSRRVALTPAGQAFLAGARSAVVVAQGAADAARRAASERPRFRLGVDLDVPDRLVRRIRRFGSEQPDVDLRVTITQQDDLLAALDRGELDAAAVWAGAPAAAPSAATARLAAVPLSAVLPAGDALAGRDRVARADLLERPLALYLPTAQTRPFYDHLLAELGVAGRVPRVTHVRAVDDAQEAMLDAVERGGGVTICVEGHLDGGDRPALVARPFDPPIHAEVVVRWHGAEPPPAVTALRAWLAP